MKRIPLTKGRFAVVDDEDYARIVAAGPWMFVWAKPNRIGYGAKRVRHERPTIVFLHRLVMRAGPRQRVDHADRDTLNCRKRNLRFATWGGSNANRGKHGGARQYSSKYKGVYRPHDYVRWIAHITIDGRTKGVRGVRVPELPRRLLDLVRLA
jgi:hypothetical protein